ncbi:sperm axonemal maintenance protein CFAP97D1-like [Diadema setosum]|uniref:sperm axonemal maintenance protein CFAP97D1-like n=1 Tax=Diadema setosum TaxID=31175 RepID=UPI003B3AA7AE
MHRAYQPITPANNKLLKKRWDERRFDRHRMKVQNAKPVIDDKPPKTYMHLHLKLKKMQMEEERLTIIERDNRILLEKMCHIMLTTGSVDNKNYYDSKSLNRMARQRELLRVTHENQAIMRRILSKQATYSRHQWEDEWKLNKMYMKNIAKYPQWYESAYDQWNKKHTLRRSTHSRKEGADHEASENTARGSLARMESANRAEKPRNQERSVRKKSRGDPTRSRRRSDNSKNKPNGCGVS